MGEFLQAICAQGFTTCSHASRGNAGLTENNFPVSPGVGCQSAKMLGKLTFFMAGWQPAPRHVFYGRLATYPTVYMF
jgi:hypothetical protein